jgi:DNA-binding CsgD family transcriptional regulator
VLYGRDAELAAIERLVDSARSGAGGAIVVRGAPGIGKSALLAELTATLDDVRVLAARGIEAEADLPFASLHQLLRGVWADIEAGADAACATVRESFGADVGSNQQRFLVYSACLTVLSDLAGDRPIVCLVDDAHWLDSESSEALQFVARRLGCEPIAFVFAARDDEERHFDGGDLPTLPLEPLGAEPSAALLRRTAEVSEPAAQQILAQARGNPLALIELPRALDDAQLTGRGALPDQLPLTAQLESAYASRIARLPAATRDVLVVAAVDGSEDVRVIARAALVLGSDPLALDAAEEAGLVRVRGSRLEFTHPLVRPAVTGTATSGARRAAHRALATALENDEEQADRRAWHLAESAVEPDRSVVVELERAAARAERRGGLVAAAVALRRAADLSTDPDQRSRLLVRGAQNLSASGRDADAVGLLAALDDRSLSPRARAAAAFIRASATIRSDGRPADAVPALLATARDLAPEHPALAIELLPVVTFAALQARDHTAQLEAARIAEGVDTGRLGDDDRHLAESIAGFAALLQGDRPAAGAKLRSTIDWGRRTDDASRVIWASWAALWLGDDAAGDELLRRATRLARERGEIGGLAEALGMHAVQLALIAQRYDESTIAADEAMQLALDLRSHSLTLLPRSALAIVAAVRGDAPAVREHADDVVRLHRRNGHPFRASPGCYAIAVVAMAEGRWADGLDALGQIDDANDPALAIAAPEIVEAAIRLDDRDRATAALRVYEQRVELAATTVLRPRLEACRALLAGGDDADRHFLAAAAMYDVARPFDRSRIQLLHGEHLRRGGRRLDAREPLRAAVTGFDRIGATVWADRARGELRATGESVRRRAPDALTELTPQERQIAGLVAGGLTNKEVAAQLYLSPRTIDAHLRSVFAKLAITSRRDLRTVEALTSSS